MDDLDKLVRRFRDLAKEEPEHLGQPDEDRHSARIMEEGLGIFSAVMATGESGLDRFVILLSDSDPWVRCAAASCLLRHRPTVAAPVLRDLAPGNAPINLRADLTLAMWHHETTGDLPDDWQEPDDVGS